MKLLKASGLLLLVLGLLIPFSSAQASHSGGSFCEKLKKYYPKYYDRYCKPKPTCDYDLRDGAVYFNANNRPTEQNELVAWVRDSKTGMLSNEIRTRSGGYGNQAGIVTSGQNAVIHTGSGNSQYVFMINAGFDPYNKYGSKDGSVSVFKVNKCDLKLTDVKSTRGQEPRAVTRHKDLVYVVNAGSAEFIFNGCPGLGVNGFLAPTGFICDNFGEPVPDDEFDPTSINGYKFSEKNGRLYTIKGSNVGTEDTDGDPAQISFINEGRQVIIAQRNTFFALGDGTEDDIVEVFNLNKWGKPVGGPVVSTTTGNDNFGFSVYPRDGDNYNDCVMMTHGSFQQRDQGGTSVFTVNGGGSKVRIIPNKPDGGSDTCWTAISNRTNTLYTAAFFDSEISIRSINPDTCNLTDGGPPVVVIDGVPQFGQLQTNGQPCTDPETQDCKIFNLTHRVTSAPARDGDNGALATDQSDFLFEAGGLDMATSQSKKGGEFLYALNAPVPFAVTTDDKGNFLWPGDAGLEGTPVENGASTIAIYHIQSQADCDAGNNTIFNFCRAGDLVFVGRLGVPFEASGIQSSGYGMAAY